MTWVQKLKEMIRPSISKGLLAARPIGPVPSICHPIPPATRTQGGATSLVGEGEGGEVGWAGVLLVMTMEKVWMLRREGGGGGGGRCSDQNYQACVCFCCCFVHCYSQQFSGH